MSFNGSYDIFQNSSPDDFQELDSFLDSHDLWRKTVPRDKYSLFRCISEHLYNSQNLYLRAQNHYFRFMSNSTHSSNSPLTQSFFDKSNDIFIDFGALSALFHLNFQIIQKDKPYSVSNLKFSKKYLTIVQTEDDHFDLVYPRIFKQNLSFVQSLVYTILYKTVFQIDVPYSMKDFTLQSIRDTYFLKQDVYEFSHLERCLNSFYYENLIIRNWNYDTQNTVLTSYDNLSCISYAIGDVVKVFSPNTDNKPFYLAKIVKLNVTPGMHEVLAPNRGTELVDIGHLKPVLEQDDTYDNDSVLTHSATAKSIKFEDADVSAKSSAFRDGIPCEVNQSNFPVATSISTNGPTAKHSNNQNISNVSQPDLINQVPPGFEEMSIIPTSSKLLTDSGSLAFSSLDIQQVDDVAIKAPKHKYGPQSAAVKQKFTQEPKLDSKSSVSGLKPYEQVSENAHSQIKKLQFKLNSSSNFLSPKFSIHPEGSDLPEEKHILQYFYNLGVQYQLMRSHGSNWKDVLPNSCPPLYHDNNYHSSNPMIPILFRDSAGVYFSQDVLLPNYYYDMTMLPFIQGYLPSMPYGMQGEQMVLPNYGKNLKEEHELGKLNQLGEFSSPDLSSENEVSGKSNLHFNNKTDNELYSSKSRNFEASNLQNIQIFNQKNPQDNPQSDPNSWPQPGGDKNVGNISWIHNINDSQRPAYSNALKKGTSSKQHNYTAERTIYASSMTNPQFPKTAPKRLPSSTGSNSLTAYQK